MFTSTSRQKLWHALLSAALLCSAGCSDEDTHLPPIDGGGGASVGLDVEPCEDGEQRSCSETLDYEAGVMKCFHGVQTCEDGRFGACEDGEITIEAAPPMRRRESGLRLLSISTPETCDDSSSPFFNPCDTGCRYFDEDPADIIANPAVPPAPPTYNGNPASTMCNVDPCTASASPMDYGCSDCVSDVCDLDMSCCTTAWTQECVNSALDLCYGIDVPDIPGLCGFGLFSDTTLTSANRPATNAMIGSYGDLTIGTDAALYKGGIVTAGNLTFNSLNGNPVTADQGIHVDGNITSQNSNTTLTGDMFAGGTIDLPAWTLSNGYEVSAVGNITGANGTTAYGDINTNGTISGVNITSAVSCQSPSSCYTHTPVSLPPQTAGTAIPILTTNCTGTTDFIQSGGNTTIPGPGVYDDVNITNNGNLTLNGEGTYYFDTFYLDGGSLILQPDMGGTVGWDIRVCNAVTLHDGTEVQGGSNFPASINDSNGVLLDPTLMTFYADTTGTVTMGTDVYFSGIMMVPKGTVQKANMNSVPHRIDVEAGTRAAPVQGAIWAHTLNLGTSALTYQMSESDCEDMNIPGTADGPGVYPGSCPTDNVLPASPGALESPCVSGADCQMNHHCLEPQTDSSCGHSKCATGAALTSTCDPCVEAICDVDPTCCSGMWTAACVDLVDTVCDAVCGSTAPESGTCTDNAGGFTESCGGYDLALGIPCEDEIDICNHGDTAFFGDVRVGYWPDNDNQMGTTSPLMSPEGTCDVTNLSIASGRCATITCAVPAGTYTLMVDPEDTLSECDNRRSDNWSVDDDRACPVTTATTTRLEVEAYDDYSNASAGGTDAGLGGDTGFGLCSDGSGCGFASGWLEAGDYIEWNYSAPHDGLYSVDVRLASNAASWSHQIQVDGATVATSSGAATGGWDTWSTFQSTQFFLSAGDHTIRLNFVDAAQSQNVNFIEVHSPDITDDTIVRTFDYEAECPDPETTAVWTALGWNADTPDASTVTFEGVVADSAAELATAMADPSSWTFIAEAQSQNLPVTESCPFLSSCEADITSALSLSSNQGQFFGLRITVDPDIATTTLYDWVVAYSCVYDQ